MKKIFFSLNPPEGSYGGGSFFVKNLIEYLQKKNYNIIFELEDNIDLLFIIDPRKGPYKKYNIDDFIKYKKNNSNVKIIHRVNECDIKREKSINIEPLLVKTMKFADQVVFVSKWLQNYFINKYNLKIKSNAILNGCNNNNFFPSKKPKFTRKIKLFTHHWANNYLKGFHIYNKLDKLLQQNPKFKNIEFTYLGNYNNHYKPKNIKLLPCNNGNELGNIIREQDIYLTATQNEPGAMHYLEGLSCGLPVLYCKGGGGAQEICCMAGEEYSDIETLLEKIKRIKDNYDEYVNKIDYDYLSSERCCKEYFNIVTLLI